MSKRKRDYDAEWGELVNVSASPVHEEFVEPAFFIARKAWIHLERGNFDAARNMIEEAERELRLIQFPGPPPTMIEKLNMAIAELPLCVRTINGLEEAGVIRVKELLELNQADVLQIGNFGEKTLREIMDVLALLEINDDNVRGRTEGDATREEAEACCV
jgi:DNA-directed RNA polymerase alpha subunit